jgi:hypothetical protein
VAEHKAQIIALARIIYEARRLSDEPLAKSVWILIESRNRAVRLTGGAGRRDWHRDCPEVARRLVSFAEVLDLASNNRAVGRRGKAIWRRDDHRRGDRLIRPSPWVSA